MQTLKEGSTGNDVKRLQRRLKELGFNPGAIDGVFGTATEAAVMAFQKSNGLLADGVVGPRTSRALFGDVSERFVVDISTESVIDQINPQLVSKMFPQTPLDNIKKHLLFVLDALVEVGLTSKNMVLMALATIRAETEGFRPIDEGISRFNTSPGGRPFDLYDHRADLGNEGPPDGERYKGRGFVQLTGRDNYKRFGREIGLGDGLVNNPDRANDPTIAARLLARFIKSKELAIKEALLDGNLKQARRLVNGGSHGFDRFENAFRIGDSLIA